MQDTDGGASARPAERGGAAAKHDIASLVSGEVFEQIQLVIDSADMVLGFG